MQCMAMLCFYTSSAVAVVKIRLVEESCCLLLHYSEFSCSEKMSAYPTNHNTAKITLQFVKLTSTWAEEIKLTKN